MAVMIFWIIQLQKKNRDLKDETKAINADLATWKLKYTKLMKAEEEAKEKKNSMDTGNSRADFDTSLNLLQNS